MKIRNGFISNSSSSSFLIACKLTSKKNSWGEDSPNFVPVLKSSGIVDGSPFAGLVLDALDLMWSEGKTFKNWQEWLDKSREWDKNLTEDHCALWTADEDWETVDVRKLFKEGWIIKTGEAESSDGQLMHLHNLTLNFESNHLIIKKHGGH